MKICIFCSANNNIDRTYFEATKELGRWLALQGHQIVFGGVSSGLMECVARAAHEAGGTCIGVVPEIVEKGGRTSTYNDVVITCRDLNERKQLMLAEGDVFVALPGGVGTLDEVFTVAAAYTIGYHQKRVILYNVNGFWDSTVQMLDDLAAKGVIRGRWRDYICIADSLDDLNRHFCRE